MAADFTVLAIEGERPWTGKHGSFVDYTISVDSGGKIATVVQTRKPDSPAPSIGEVIYGHIETEDIPKKDGGTFTKTKLRRDKRPDGASPPTAQGPQTGSNPSVTPPGQTGAAGQPGLSKDEEIRWAVALKAAAEFYARRPDATPAVVLDTANAFYNASPRRATTDNGAGEEKTPAFESLADKVKDAPAEMHVSEFDGGDF